MVGGAIVEAPRVADDKVVGWDVDYWPERKFATDMAGFAVNLDLILHELNAQFVSMDDKEPESYFLETLNIDWNDLQPFGHHRLPKEILVWHTKTKRPRLNGTAHGYIAEI